MNAYKKHDTKPCYKCQERRLKCHSECERYAKYRKLLDEYNAETKRRERGNPAPRHWKKCLGKWVRVK